MTSPHFLNASRARTTAILITLAWIASVPLFSFWNLTITKIQPKWSVRIGRTLNGAVVSPVIPRPLWNSFERGMLQKAVADLVTQSVAYRPLLVRLNNEGIFSVLRSEPEPKTYILRGDQDVLIEEPYLREYCSRSLADFLPKAQVWARKLREIQDYYAGRGATFLYVITPSKAVGAVVAFHYRYPCLNDLHERDEFLPRYVAILTTAGVNVVDTASFTATSANRGVTAFPRGGAHWNDLAAAEATQAVITKLNHLNPLLQIPALTWASSISNNPRGTDRDLVDLLNLLRQSWSDEVPKLVFASSKSCNRKISATIIGGSFMHVIAEMLTKTGCVEQADLYFYFHLFLFRSPGHQLIKQDLQPIEIAAIRQAPLVVLEENEMIMARSIHGPELHRLIFEGPPETKTGAQP